MTVHLLCVIQCLKLSGHVLNTEGQYLRNIYRSVVESILLPYEAWSPEQWHPGKLSHVPKFRPQTDLPNQTWPFTKISRWHFWAIKFERCWYTRPVKSTHLPTSKTEDLTIHKVKYLSPQSSTRKMIFVVVILIIPPMYRWGNSG